MKTLFNNISKNQQYISFKRNDNIESTIYALSGVNTMQQYAVEKEREKEQKASLRDDIAYVSAELIKQYYKKGNHKYINILYPSIRDKQGIPDLYKEKYYAALSFIKQGNYDTASQVLIDAKTDALAIGDKKFAEKIDKKIIENKILSETTTKEENESYSKLNDLDILAAYDYKNGNLEEYTNDISINYELKKQTNKKISNSMAFKYALLLSQNNKIEDSQNIVNERLKKLKEENLIESEDFAKFLILGAENLQKKADNDNEDVDNNKLKNIYETAYSIAEKIDNKDIKKLSTYNLIRIEFENNVSYKIISDSDVFIKEFGNDKDIFNAEYMQNIYRMRGDFYKSQNLKDKAQEQYIKEKEYIDKLENIPEKARLKNIDNLINTTNDQDKILLYKSYLADTKDTTQLSFKELGDIFIETLSKKNYDKIITMSDSVKENSDSAAKNTIADIYKNLSLIYKEDTNTTFQQKAAILTNKINYLEDIISNNKRETEYKNLFFDIYRHFSTVFLNRGLVSANDIENAQKYFIKAENYMEKSPESIKETKRLGTLITYKNKDYNLSEKYCEEYLGSLVGRNFSINELDNPKFVKDIANNYEEASIIKIATAFETLGLINLKKNYIEGLDIKQFFKSLASHDKAYLNTAYINNADKYFTTAIKLRENLNKVSIELVNDYTAMSRIETVKRDSKESNKYHTLAIDALNQRYPDQKDLIAQETEFHKKYYTDVIPQFGKLVRQVTHFIVEKVGNPYVLYNEIFSKFKLISEDINL